MVAYVYIRSWYSLLERVPYLLVSFVTDLIVYESPPTTYSHIPLVLPSCACVVTEGTFLFLKFEMAA